MAPAPGPGGRVAVEVRVPEDLWPTRPWEGRLVAVHVGEGDCVERDQVVAEVEVEKAVIEVTCPSRGRIVKVLARPGDRVRPGQPLLLLEPGAC